MDTSLLGKVGLVTGSGSGIGRACALALANEGAKVVVNDVVTQGGKETVDLINKAGGKAVFVQGDVANSADVRSLINCCVSTFGRLDCAVNNAGILGQYGVPTAECTEDNWAKVIAVNLTGLWLCMKYEIGQMLKQGNGAIVNMASTDGLRGTAGIPAYVASKHGAIGLTKATALEYAKSGIRVNAVCPTATLTPLVQPLLESRPEMRADREAIIPMRRLATVEEIAKAVVFLSSDAASFITGQALPVDGGKLAK